MQPTLVGLTHLIPIEKSITLILSVERLVLDTASRTPWHSIWCTVDVSIAVSPSAQEVIEIWCSFAIINIIDIRIIINMLSVLLVAFLSYG